MRRILIKQGNGTQRNTEQFLHSGKYYVVNLLFILAYFIMPSAAFAQDRVTMELLISTFVYQFSKNIEWPEDGATTFRIAVFGKVKLSEFKALQALEKFEPLDGRSISVENVRKVDQLSGFHVIVYLKAKTGEIRDIFNQIDGKPVLLITKGATEKQLLMINLVDELDKRLGFEVNKANIIGQGLKARPTLILLGGTEIDVAKLYKDGQASLFELQKRLARFSARANVMETLIKDHKTKLLSLSQKAEDSRKKLLSLSQKAEDSRKKLQSREIEVMGLTRKLSLLEKNIAEGNLQIEKQKKALKSQQVERQRLLDEITVKELQLADRNTQLEAKQAMIARLKNDIEVQKKEVVEREQKITGIQNNIRAGTVQLDQQREKITEQKGYLALQELKISSLGQKVATQKNIVRMAIGLISVTIILLATIVFAYRNKQKDNQQLLIQQCKLKETRDELVVSRQAAIDANQAKSDFLACVSHEIRTPMNAVLGFSEILMEKETSPGNAHYIKSIYSSANNLLDLINDILDLSKIEAGKFELQYEPTSVNNLLDDVYAMFEGKAEKKGLYLSFETDSSIPCSLLLDTSRTRQILINLIGNALKFTETGEVHVKARILNDDIQTQNAVTLVLTVQDTGIGIPAEQQQRIFEPFDQARGQKIRQYGGSGLGLSICQHLVSKMGGAISLESAVGVGSTFTITLPEVEVSPLDTLPSAENASLNFSTIHFEPCTILIADDIDFNRDILSSFLESWEFTFLFATSGVEVLQILDKVTPGLLLLDLKMPIMDGYAVIRELEGRQPPPEFPIVVVSASTIKKETQTDISSCNGYLEKPVKKSELIYELMKHLPHQVDVPPLPQSSEEFDTEKSAPERLSSEQRTLIEDVHDKRLQPEWHRVSTYLVFDDVHQFSLHVSELATQSHCPHLERWAAQLEDACAGFDYEGVKHYLNDYQRMISELLQGETVRIATNE